MVSATSDTDQNEVNKKFQTASRRAKKINFRPDEKWFICFKAVNQCLNYTKEKKLFALLKWKYPAVETNLFLFNIQSISIKS